MYNDSVDKYFVRALLGVPGSYSYKPTNEPCHKKNDKEVSPNYMIEDDYEIEVYHPNVERFKSPITFKPIKNDNKTQIYIIPDKSYENILRLTEPFTLYKKFIANYAYINDRSHLVFKKEKPFPNINGSSQNDVNNIINKLKRQENDLQNLFESNNNDRNPKRIRKNECILNKIISGQKDRFKVFLNECTIIDGKYYPPSAEIAVPNDNFDLEELLDNYHNNELNNNFTFRVESNDIHAKIKKL